MIAYIPGGIILSRLPDPLPSGYGSTQRRWKEGSNGKGDGEPPYTSLYHARQPWALSDLAGYSTTSSKTVSRRRTRLESSLGATTQRPGIDYNERCKHSHPSCALNPSTCFDLARAAILTWTVIPKRRHYHRDYAHDRIAAGIYLQARYA